MGAQGQSCIILDMNQVFEFRLCWSNCVQYHLYTAAIIAVTQVVSFLNEKQFVSKYFTLMKMVTVLCSLEEAWFWKYILVIWKVHITRELLEMTLTLLSFKYIYFETKYYNRFLKNLCSQCCVPCCVGLNHRHLAKLQPSTSNTNVKVTKYSLVYCCHRFF